MTTATKEVSTRMRARLVAGLLSIAALLAVAAPASAASFVAHLSAPGHHPKAGHRWPITVSARTASGAPLRATATYQFLYHGQRVNTQYPSPHGPTRHSPYPFRGSFRDASFTWPARAVGYPLTLRVVVSVRGRGTKHLDYWVRVRR